MCIFCFLDKQNQKNLRERAQLSTDRFEHSLLFYKKIYMNGYTNCIDEPLCSTHERLKKQYDNLKQVDISLIDKVFEIFEMAYIDWINNNSKQSIDSIANFLDENKLFKKVSLSNKLMYRARFSDARLSHWDMFHIPFNKRFLIKNQRYSLVGRPMLYLGFSPKYVLKEIGYDEESSNGCFLSTYYLKNNENIEVCDFRYNFPKQESSIIGKLLDEDDIDIDFEEVKQSFLLSIISSICSFKKRSQDRNEFSEEYVLPQILSEIVNTKAYNGLLYTSTRTEETSNGNAYYDANAVIFTEYERDKRDVVTYVYDKSLYQKFTITTAKKIEDLDEKDKDILKNTFENSKLVEGLSSFLKDELSNAINNLKNDDMVNIIHRSIIYEIIVNNYM